MQATLPALVLSDAFCICLGLRVEALSQGQKPSDSGSIVRAVRAAQSGLSRPKTGVSHAYPKQLHILQT